MNGSEFHPAVARWFEQALGAPTDPQRLGWPAIQSGRHTLISAPTGSGKTLAAFLASLDALFREGTRRDLPDEMRVLYVSPLKALSNDIRKNLQEPLAGIRTRLVASDGRLVNVRAEVRTGDTPQHVRQALAKKPPHILVTTPESFYLMLTSASGRRMLKTVRTLIVDEIHALVGNRRGSHLSLSMERLTALVEHPLQRIGLSATQKPIEQVARFLVGNRSSRGDEALNLKSEIVSRKSQIDQSLLTSAATDADSCLIINTGHRRALDLALELPGSPLEAVMSLEVWSEVHQRLVELIQAHQTTLVFVNTRRMAERIAHQLCEMVGKDKVTSHHGSLSAALRLDAEDRLKRGELKALVATASLELGIDIGSVDLVCQLGSPRAIATLLQRVGRAEHRHGGLPKGRLFPLTRDELVECTALLRCVRHGELDSLIMPEQPLDVLAQQIVAATACEEWKEDELFALAQRAWPYRNLTRAQFDEVVTMLSDGFSTRRGRRGALLYHDGVNGRLRARRGARMIATTCGGAIPETGDLRVVLEPEETFLGTLNEDFAIESMAGDIFQLGNASWRITRVTTSEVRVEDARGQPPTIPFWLGEAPARTDELSAAVSRLREDVEQIIAGRPAPLTPSLSPHRMRGEGARRAGEGCAWSKDEAVTNEAASVAPHPDLERRTGFQPVSLIETGENGQCDRLKACPTKEGRNEGEQGVQSPSDLPDSPDAVKEWLIRETGISEFAATQLAGYLVAAQRALGVLPSQNRLLMERFFDESGGMQLVIHAPFGARLNRAWGLALRKRFCRSFNFELQAAATDDALVLSLGTQHSFPLDEVYRYLHPASARDVLVQALLDAPMFTVRWRWNANRALAVQRMKAGTKNPPALQRMEAENLLAAVFPDQLACLENIAGDREVPDHPLVRQTIHDCLTEAMDIDGLEVLLKRIDGGAVECHALDLPEPSPLAHEILNARPCAFLDDAPLEERRTRAVYTRRTLDAARGGELGVLDADAIQRVVTESWPTAANADELHDALMLVGVMTEAEVERTAGIFRSAGPIENSPGREHGDDDAMTDKPRKGRQNQVGSIAAPPELRPDAHVEQLANLFANRRAGRFLLPHPDPLPKEREQPEPRAPLEDAYGAGDRPSSLPLPKGEGWGEGEECGRSVAHLRLVLPAERLPMAQAIYGGLAIEPPLRAPERELARHWERADAIRELLRGRMEICGPVTVASLAQLLGLSEREIEAGLIALEGEGFVLRGKFHPGTKELEWCDRRLLARIHRLTINRLRAEIEPVTPAVFSRFLVTWHRVGEPHQVKGPEGLAAVLEQLDGYELPAGAWEPDVLSARVAEYDPQWLDRLCLTGRLGWGRLTPPQAVKAKPFAPLRTSPVALCQRTSLPAWLALSAGAQSREFSPETQSVLKVLEHRGAVFFDELVARTGALPSLVEQALGELVAAGWVTADSFDGLRAMLVPSDKRHRFTAAAAGATAWNRRHRAATSVEFAGRWSFFRPASAFGSFVSAPYEPEAQRAGQKVAPGVSPGLSAMNEQAPAGAKENLSPLPGLKPHGHTDPGLTPGAAFDPRLRRSEGTVPARDEREEQVTTFANTLLRRYGVVFRRLLEREAFSVSWYELGRVFRRMEARGEVRGGHFVRGVSGEQFALPDAIGLMRTLRKAPEKGELVTIAAADPLNLVGILTPGARVPATAANRILLRDGVPVAALEGGQIRRLDPDLDVPDLAVERALKVGRLSAKLRPFYA